jgi:hypothetical protein
VFQHRFSTPQRQRRAIIRKRFAASIDLLQSIKLFDFELQRAIAKTQAERIIPSKPA